MTPSSEPPGTQRRRDVRAPYRFYLGAMLFLVGVVSTLLVRVLAVHPLYAYLVAANLASFVLMGFDKRLAQVGAVRVPEAVLWTAAAVGGSLGTLAGAWMFRHKTRKASFQAMLVLIVMVQYLL